VLGVLAGCSDATAVSTPSTTTTAAPERRPTVDDPLRVIVAGDSLAGEVKLPIEYALEGSGRVDLHWELVPALPRRPRAVARWPALLRRQRPDLVVVLVGYWETYAPEHRIVPFVDDVADVGAELAWIGSPLPLDASRAPAFAELNDAFATADPRINFFDAQAAVGDRHRWPDGLHLCPEGALQVATPVIHWISRRWNLPLTPDWQQGGWRNAVFSGVEECAGR
jgi:hypothetical protein